MKKLFTLAAAVLFTAGLFAEDHVPTTTLDVKETAGTDEYVSYNLVGSIAGLPTYIGYNAAGTGSVESFMSNTTRWKLNSSRWISFKVKNCDSVAINCYFMKDATHTLSYKIGSGDATGFLSNGSDKKCEKTGGFKTDDSDEIVITLSASNDILLGIIKFFPASGTPAVTYTVTYVANSGIDETNIVDDKAKKVADCEFTAPSGKTFDGWNTKAEGDGVKYAVGDKVTSDLTLYAQWEDLYTVTFNLQGHGDAIAEQKVKKGNKATKPRDPAAEGYLFEGWYKEDACETAWDFENDVVNEDTELFAKWTSYKVNVKLVIDKESDATPAANAAVALTTGTTGGAIYFAGAKDNKYTESFSYNENYGLLLGKSGADSLRVELDSKLKLQAGSIIFLQIYANGTGSRGLNIVDSSKKTVFAATWNASVAGECKEIAYVVKETDTNLINAQKFVLQRNNSVYLSKVIVGNCKDSGGETAIDNTEVGEKAVKMIENGQLVIIKNGVKYNAQGTIVK